MPFGLPNYHESLEALHVGCEWESVTGIYGHGILFMSDKFLFSPEFTGNIDPFQKYAKNK